MIKLLCISHGLSHNCECVELKKGIQYRILIIWNVLKQYLLIIQDKVTRLPVCVYLFFILQSAEWHCFVLQSLLSDIEHPSAWTAQLRWCFFFPFTPLSALLSADDVASRMRARETRLPWPKWPWDILPSPERGWSGLLIVWWMPSNSDTSSLLSMSPGRTQSDRNTHTHYTKPRLSVQRNPSWIQMRSQPAISSPSNHYYPLPLGRRELNSFLLLKALYNSSYEVNALLSTACRGSVGMQYGKWMTWRRICSEFCNNAELFFYH